MEDLYEYAMRVHQSLLQPVQFFGIGEQAFMIILMVTVIFASLISVWCISLGGIALIVTRFLCKKEPYLIDFIIQNLDQCDVYRG